MLIGKPFGVTRVTTQCDKNAFLDFGMSQRAQKLSYLPDTNVPRLPLFALNGSSFAILFD